MQSHRRGREALEGEGRAAIEEDRGFDQGKGQTVAIQRAIRPKIAEPAPDNGQNQTLEKAINLKIRAAAVRLQQTVGKDAQHFQVAQPVRIALILNKGAETDGGALRQRADRVVGFPRRHQHKHRAARQTEEEVQRKDRKHHPHLQLHMIDSVIMNGYRNITSR